MNNKAMVEHYLRGQPLFRERKNKNRGVARLLITMHPTLKDVPIEILTDVITDAATLDRWWRKILEEKPELRGNDYGHKDKLEEKKQIELGY